MSLLLLCFVWCCLFCVVVYFAFEKPKDGEDCIGSDVAKLES